jgi:hypothetical protein
MCVYTHKTTARLTGLSKPIDNKQNTNEHQINTYTNWQRWDADAKEGGNTNIDRQQMEKARN